MKPAPWSDEEIIALENRLLAAERHGSQRDLQILLDDDFLEVGTSGVLRRKFDALTPRSGAGSIEFNATEFRVTRLGDHAALITYLVSARRSEPEAKPDTITWSRRSSIWRRQDGLWQIIWHQGTRCDHRLLRATADLNGPTSYEPGSDGRHHGLS